MRYLGRRLLAKYIFFEILPGFLLGAAIFVLVLLMFQSLRLTEFMIVHGVKPKVILEIVTYLSVSFLPAILPMSLLFSILLAYGRMSSDSEIVVMKSLGYSQWYLIVPGIVFAVLVSIASAYTSFSLAPWGNRRFELLFEKVGSQKVAATIREGTFAEGFFDLVVYANKVDSKRGLLSKVFIFDERDKKQPLTIIARRGEIVKSTNPNSPKTHLRLIDGDIHRTGENTYTKINFKSYDIHFAQQTGDGFRKKSFPSFTLKDLEKSLADPALPPEKRRRYLSEYHKRWAISLTCIVFAILGIGLGAVTNHRSARSSGLVTTIGLIVVFWAMYVGADAFVQSSNFPVGPAIWAPNFLFLIGGIYALKRSWN